MATAAENNPNSNSDSDATNSLNATKTDCLNEFVRIGRTGRRNAVADLNLGILYCNNRKKLIEIA